MPGVPLMALLGVSLAGFSGGGHLHLVAAAPAWRPTFDTLQDCALYERLDGAQPVIADPETALDSVARLVSHRYPVRAAAQPFLVVRRDRLDAEAGAANYVLGAFWVVTLDAPDGTVRYALDAFDGRLLGFRRPYPAPVEAMEGYPTRSTRAAAEAMVRDCLPQAGRTGRLEGRYRGVTTRGCDGYDFVEISPDGAEVPLARVEVRKDVCDACGYEDARGRRALSPELSEFEAVMRALGRTNALGCVAAETACNTDGPTPVWRVRLGFGPDRVTDGGLAHAATVLITSAPDHDQVCYYYDGARGSWAPPRGRAARAKASAVEDQAAVLAQIGPLTPPAARSAAPALLGLAIALGTLAGGVAFASRVRKRAGAEH